MKFVHTKVHNGNRNGESCLTSFEIPTLQLKQYQGDLVLMLNFTLLRISGTISFTNSVMLNSLSCVDLIFPIALQLTLQTVYTPVVG